MNLFSKQAVEIGNLPGAPPKVCGNAIIPAGTPTGYAWRRRRGRTEMRRAVREQVQGGADLIKIMAVMTCRNSPMW